MKKVYTRSVQKLNRCTHVVYTKLKQVYTRFVQKMKQVYTRCVQNFKQNCKRHVQHGELFLAMKNY